MRSDFISGSRNGDDIGTVVEAEGPEITVKKSGFFGAVNAAIAAGVGEALVYVGAPLSSRPRDQPSVVRAVPLRFDERLRGAIAEACGP